MKIKKSDVEFTIECLPEDLQIEGNASAIDEETDKQIAEEIHKQLDAGNEWAWCTVKVTANWNGLEGTDFLGACSYKSKEDFMAGGGYWEDMQEQAYKDLLKQITGLKSKVCGVEV